MTSHSWVSKQTLKQLSVDFKTCENGVSTEFNGDILRSVGTVSLSWFPQGCHSKLHSEFYVADREKIPDLLAGYDILPQIETLRSESQPSFEIDLQCIKPVDELPKNGLAMAEMNASVNDRSAFTKGMNFQPTDCCISRKRSDLYPSTEHDNTKACLVSRLILCFLGILAALAVLLIFDLVISFCSPHSPWGSGFILLVTKARDMGLGWALWLLEICVVILVLYIARWLYIKFRRIPGDVIERGGSLAVEREVGSPGLMNFLFST
jgi:hypothetical protein